MVNNCNTLEMKMGNVTSQSWNERGSQRWNRQGN